jgi:CRP-like cAMP-binding protein
MVPFCRAPGAIFELALLGGFCAASVLVVTTAGTARLLSHEGSEALPLVYLLLAVVSIPLASSLSWALGRRSAIQVCRIACLAALAVSAALQAALMFQVAGCHLATCVIGYVLEIILDTMFWLVVAEYLPTRDLKRHTARLAMAFAIGGVGGGVLASLFCRIFPVDYLMLLACVLLGGCFLLCSRLSRLFQPLANSDAAEDEPRLLDALRSSCGVFRAFPIAGLIAMGVVLMSALFCLQDYLSMTIFADTFTDEDALTRFMALLFAGQQAVEILVLATFGRLIINRSGPVIRNLFFPLSTAICLVALLGCWSLPAALLVSLNANAVSNGVFEPVKTMNYAAVPHRALGPMRMLVEGMIYPLGIAGSGAGLLVLQSHFPPQMLLSTALLLSTLFLASSAALGMMFAPSMVRSLRVRSMHPSRYSSGLGSGTLSRSDARKLLLHPSPGLRRHAQELVRELFPALLCETAADNKGRVSRCMGLHQSRRRRPSPQALRRQEAARSDQAAREKQQGGRPDFHDIGTLALGLDHSTAEVRHAAARSMARHGDDALPALAERLASERQETAEAAIMALGAIGSRRARRILRDHLRPLRQRAQRNLAALAEVKRSTQTGACAERSALFSEALEDRNRAILRRILCVQAALGDQREVLLLHHLALSGDIRERSDAIEALTSAQGGQFLRPLLHILEPGTSTADGAAGRLRMRRPPAADTDAVLWAAAAEDPWLRLLVAPLLGKIQPFPNNPREVAMLDVILFLKSLPLFNALSFESIARAAAASDRITLPPATSLPASAGTAQHVHVLRDGYMEVLAGGCAVDVLEPGAFWGVGAVIGDDEGDYAAQAASKCDLIRFPTSVIADLAAENPQMLRTMLRDTHRMQRAAHLRLAGEQVNSTAPAGFTARSLGLVRDNAGEEPSSDTLSRARSRSVG